MKDIRIGNTFIVLWAIRVQDPTTEEVVDYNLEGKHLELYYISQCGERSRAEGFTVKNNIITWKFQGSDQKDLGVYTIVLVENEDGHEQRILDITKAFRLVRNSESATGEENTDGVVIETVELASVANFVMMHYVISQELGEKEDVTISQKAITGELNRRVISQGIKAINTQYTEEELKIMAEEGTLEEDVLYLGFKES